MTCSSGMHDMFFRYALSQKIGKPKYLESLGTSKLTDLGMIAKISLGQLYLRETGLNLLNYLI